MARRLRYAPVATRALVYGGILSLTIAVAGSAIGYLIAGDNGLVSALVGALIAAVFMGLTAASAVGADRLTRDKPSITVFSVVVLGVWVVKLVLFLFALIVLRSQHWLSPYVFFFALLASVIGSLATDAIALLRARVLYVGNVVLPGDVTPSHAPETTSQSP